MAGLFTPAPKKDELANAASKVTARNDTQEDLLQQGIDSINGLFSKFYTTIETMQQRRARQETETLFNSGTNNGASDADLATNLAVLAKGKQRTIALTNHHKADFSVEQEAVIAQANRLR